jgi:hypothetical protein
VKTSNPATQFKAEDRTLRASVPKWEEVAEENCIGNEALCNMTSSTNIIGITKPRKRLTGHVARMGKNGNVTF